MPTCFARSPTTFYITKWAAKAYKQIKISSDFSYSVLRHSFNWPKLAEPIACKRKRGRERGSGRSVCVFLYSKFYAHLATKCIYSTRVKDELCQASAYFLIFVSALKTASTYMRSWGIQLLPRFLHSLSCLFGAYFCQPRRRYQHSIIVLLMLHRIRCMCVCVCVGCRKHKCGGRPRKILANWQQSVARANHIVYRYVITRTICLFNR